MKRFVWIVLGLFSSYLFGATAPTPLPLPIVVVPQHEQPIVLSSLAVETHIVGSLAKSRITLQFYNPNARMLEGMLEFPLKEQQSIESFALESLDGKSMLPSSAVEKEKGEQVFESIERYKADPALLSQTQGNNFKLRLYPLMPKKKRTVTLDIVEKLNPTPQGYLSYDSPLAFESRAFKKRSIHITMHGIAAASIIKERSSKAFKISSKAMTTRLSLEDAIPKNTPLLTWKPTDEAHTVISSYEGKTYFVSELPLQWISMVQKPSSHIAIIWDASASGEKRNHAKELAFLDRYFKELPKETTAHVTLKIVRNSAEPVQMFQIQNGDWSVLKKVLETTPYDGASNASSWSVPEEFTPQDSLALLFSDGLSNWGDTPPKPSPVPLFTISASEGDNSRYLKHLAHASNGRYINLLLDDGQESLLTLKKRMTRILDVSAIGAEKLILASPYPQNGRIVVAGILSDEKATLNIERENPDGHRIKQNFIVALNNASSHPTFAAKQWARLSIDALEAELSLNKREITRLGKAFGLVSSQTSLIILETLEDYLRYDVLPPRGELRDSFTYMHEKRAIESHAKKSKHLDRLTERFQRKIVWWEKEFPKDDKKHEPPSYEKSAMAPRSAAPMMREVMASAPAPMAPKVSTTAPSNHLSIHLQPFTPNAPYAKRIMEASAELRYRVYLDEKPSYPNSTAFYLDVADIFFAKGERELAIRILSNLAEMQLENRQILRILAYRLIQANEEKLALPLLQKVVNLAPFEPQSWRDLGLLEAKIGMEKKALEHLWEVVSTPWESRFSDIDIITLAEMNALIARHPTLDISRIDQRLIRNLPLDLRAVLSWDTDNSDMDLWVIDPNDEKVYYQHTLSYQGGRISNDFTGGYGPEEFSLKTAKKGTYTIKAHFYGHRQQVLSPYTTLMLNLGTHFGTPEQKEERIILRLKDKNEDVFIGTFNVE